MLLAQILAVAIFLLMFILIIMDKIERQWITLGCGLLTILLVFGLAMHSGTAILETLNVKNIFTAQFWISAGESSESTGGINWATIIFIAGMMVMVEGMAHVGFFRWLCMCIAKAVHYRTIPIFITFMIMSFVLSMFIDSITVILFLAAVTVELSQLLSFTPIPMILAEIFCANLGGSATMCGDPPNIIIGTALKYSFADFITHTGLIAVIALVVIVFYFYFAFRKELSLSFGKQVNLKDMPSPTSAIRDKLGFGLNSAIFLCAIILLVTHSMTGFSVAFIGAVIAVITLIVARKSALSVLKRVDYKTLLFFIGLFIVVGGLEQTGILKLIADFIEKVSGGNAYVMVAIIIWVSALASAFIDNIPFAATMVPVIRSLAASTGIPLTTLAWGLAMGTDVGGSATPIGASANVVGTSVAAKSGHPIGWGIYCKKCAPATVIVLAIATVYIFVVYM